ncbi:MAG: hypothetical protein ACFB15_20030 [Cyclobacteriaceae bacterium]
MIVFAPWLVKTITFGFARAITLFPFIFMKHLSDKTNQRLINHEEIHLRQQLELFIIFFYLLYLVEYLIGRIRGLGHRQAYYNISFEQEAFGHEYHLDYLARRPVFAFVQYWKKSE